MGKIIFALHPSMGHLNSLISLAVPLKERGHEVRFFVPGLRLATNPPAPFRILRNLATVPLKILEYGIETDLQAPPLDYVVNAARLVGTSGFDETRAALKIFNSGLKSYAKGLHKVVERWEPDVLVTDFLFYALPLVADLHAIPYINIYHCGLLLDGKDIPPWGCGFSYPCGEDLCREERAAVNQISAECRGSINRARQALGAPLIDYDPIREPYSPWMNLIPSHEAIELPRENLPGHTLFVGPAFSGAAGRGASFDFGQLREGSYKIFVSMGTVFNERPDVFLKIMEGLKDQADCEIVVSAGGSYDALKKCRLPENVLLYELVPQLEVLPRMDMVIGHGGNNTLKESLAEGKPLLVLPVGGEQHDNAKRLEFLGVGRGLKTESFTPAEIRAGVAEIRADCAMAERLGELKAKMDMTDGVETSVALVEWMLEHRRPYARGDLPVTVFSERLGEYLGKGK